jgi:hypothetical protein
VRVRAAGEWLVTWRPAVSCREPLRTGKNRCWRESRRRSVLWFHGIASALWRDHGIDRSLMPLTRGTRASWRRRAGPRRLGDLRSLALSDAGPPRYTSPASQRALTGAATAFVVMFALCQSPARNLGRDQAQGPSFPTGPPTTPPSLPSCGWLRPTPSSSCASTRLAAATPGSPAVEWRPIRPVRAEPTRETIRITTSMGTTTINPAKAQRRGVAHVLPEERRWGMGRSCVGSSGAGLAEPTASRDLDR